MTVSYDDALRDSLTYFGGDELAAKVFIDKYALRDEDGELIESTPDDMHDRIARELHRIESSKFREPVPLEVIRAKLDRFSRIVPQGSPMYGIGNRYQYISISNCFVIDSPLDAYSSILKADEELVQISKRRGGVGLDISNFRPAGTRTRNSARSSTGIVPFMQRYSNSIREVGQNSRRGALMITISVHHPEVIDFATVKSDLTKVTGANISIRLTDEFLDAVRDGREYEQRWPVDSASPAISRMVDARGVWMKIIEMAHATAEPGLLFWDTILRESPADCYESYQSISTNPCMPSWARVLTPEGVRCLADVDAGQLIWSKDGWVRIVRKWSTGVNPVYRYGTTAGVFYGTEEHRVVSRGEKISACDAETIDIIAGPYSSEVVIDPQDVMDGLVIGDGSVHAASNDLVYLNVGRDDQDYFKSEVSHLLLRARPALSLPAYEISTTIRAGELPKTYERSVPERFIVGGRDKVCGFLRGLYSANGSYCGDRVTLKASSKRVIDDVQLMLSSVGIRSYYTINKPTKIKFSNGVYECKQSYDLNITTDRGKFAAIIGFIQEYKTEKVLDGLRRASPRTKPRKTTYDITSCDLVSEEETFDIEVSGTSHTYWTHGCDVSNCSELILSAADSCRLLLLNLFSYVVDPFLPDAYFDHDAFHADAMMAQRFMDDIVDLELESIDRILEKIEHDPEPDDVKGTELGLWKKVRDACLNGRRTGTGITALGDTIAALGIRYGSDESIEVAESIYKTLKLACYRSSVEMAKELGPFLVWDATRETKNPFLLRIKDEDPALYADMQEYGRRNIALLTTAPAGTVSIETQTSSGIEPVFMLSYTRRKKVNPSDTGARVDFVDPNGDRWQEFSVYHPKAKLWMEITGEDDLTKSPYHGATAEEIDWRQRVRLQAIIGKHICHSLSSTVNLPEDVTVEQVAEIYETAWEAGCKGITVYRKNSRTGVLVDSSASGATEGVRKTEAPKRPQDLPCDIYRATCGGTKFFVLVGHLNGDPYEVIAGEGHLPARHTEGVCRKVSKGVYQLVDPDGAILLENAADHCSDDQEAILRMVSISLRHGADIRFIAGQLSKVKGHLNSFARCLARVLKKYLPDENLTGESCPACQSLNMSRQEGCVACRDCGWSKCS